MVTKINSMEIKKDRIKNFRERILFINYWVNYMKKNSDRVWSEGQKDLIDSQFLKADKVYKDLKGTDKYNRLVSRLR